MEMTEGKQRQPNALHEAAIWYLRSMSKQLSSGERNEFASWLRHSPENVSSFFLVKTVVRRAVPRRRSTSRLKQALSSMLRADGSGTAAYSKHQTLSQCYYKHVKQQSIYPKMGLLAVALCGVAGWMLFEDVRAIKVAAVAFVGFGLLMLREAVVGIRVATGYFGNTEAEVRDFVKFIMAHRSDIDFTDQDGKRRSSLVPEPNADTSAGAWWDWLPPCVFILHIPSIGSHTMDTLFELIDRGDFSAAERRQLYRRLIERFVELAAADHTLTKSEVD